MRSKYVHHLFPSLSWLMVCLKAFLKEVGEFGKGMVADLLDRMVFKAVFVELIEGFTLLGGALVSFIQFADDYLFMVKDEVEGMRNLRCILLIMEVATGLKVNWAKSTVSSVGDATSMEEAVSIFGCDIAPLPITYLGLPLRAKPLLGVSRALLLRRWV